jgi:uncharacterized protein (TIGR00255 family)
MKSMTGFAKQRFAVGNNNVTIEIKTLNSKQLDLNVKLPALLRESDLPIRAALQRLDRGKVDVIVTLEESANTTTSINSAIITQRLDDIRRYAELSAYEKQLKHCPYEHDTQRTTIAKLYDDIERMNPEARFSIWKALEREGKLTEDY